MVAAGRGWAGAADRLRQCRQPAAGAVGGAQTGGCGTAGVGRRARADSPAVGHGERAAGAPRRTGRAGGGRLRIARRTGGGGQHSARGQHRLERAGSVVRAGGFPCRGSCLRSISGSAEFARRGAGWIARRRPGYNRGLTSDAKCFGGGANRSGAGAADWGKSAAAHHPQFMGGESRFQRAPRPHVPGGTPRPR